MKKNHATTTEPEDEATPLKKKRVIRKPTKKALNTTKWILLILCCIVMASMYYILAMPAALHRQLMAIMPSDHGNFEMKFNLLFTVSYFPNMILPIFGGAIVDKYGEAKCLVTFCVVVLLGQTLTAVGSAAVSWNLMLAGRLVFGLGAQNLIVANASLISKWFAGNEGTTLGLSNVFSYGGVIATNMLSPRLANVVRPAFAFWVGVGAGTLAVALSLVVAYLDQKKKTSMHMPLVCTPMFSPVAFTQHYVSPATQATVMSSPGAVVFIEVHETRIPTDASSGWGKLRDFKATFWLLCASFLLVYAVVWSFTNVSSAILLERDFFLQSPADCLPKYPNQCTSGTYAPAQGNPSVDTYGHECLLEDNVAPIIPQSLNITVTPSSAEGDDEDDDDNNNNDSNVHEVLKSYQLNHLSSSDIQCSQDFWAEGCTQDYCEDQNVATERAGFFMSIPYFFTVALTSMLGIFVDKTGLRTEMICFGSVLLVLAHVLLAFPSSSPPVVPLVGQGLGYTICVAALWPSVPFTVSADSVGLAFGIMMAVQNVGLALVPLVVAWLYGMGHDHYLPVVEVFFAACSLLAVAVGIALKIADKTTDHVLATPKSDICVREDNGTMVMLGRARHSRSNSEGNFYFDNKGGILS